GGGPAGLQAALTAAERGHRVTLLERGSSLGGLLHAACRQPHKQPYERLRLWFEHAVAHSGIDARMGVEASAENIRELRPDAVIVATGSEPVIPAFCKGSGALAAQDVLMGAECGKRTLILGGGLVGCETAEFLAEQGREVVILELRDALAPDMETRTRIFMLDSLRQLGVETLLNTEVLALSHGCARVRDKLRGERDLEGFDTLIMAFGYRSRSLLFRQLAAASLPAAAVGDCVRPGKVITAVRQGFLAAYSL
ncbi:MAG: FAD-dependent oxidoreductase, partial [Christensenellaceae bacterium]|nr:FAD-dependent oxidoreductase [Christensenellaceae bacterium]